MGAIEDGIASDIEEKNTTDDANTVTLEEMVKRHQEEGVKRKRETAEEGNEEQSEVKKKVKKERPKKKTEVNRKTIFIRNIDKDFDFDQSRVSEVLSTFVKKGEKAELSLDLFKY